MNIYQMIVHIWKGFHTFFKFTIKTLFVVCKPNKSLHPGPGFPACCKGKLYFPNLFNNILFIDSLLTIMHNHIKQIIMLYTQIGYLKTALQLVKYEFEKVKWMI